MSSRDPSLPTVGPTREESARREVGHTDVSPGTVRLLLGVFLGLIAVVPLAETIAARARAGGGESSWGRLRALPSDIRRPLSSPGEGAWTRVVAANRAALSAFARFERALEDESAAARALRPPAQVLLTGWLGAGNERVYKGRGGWLFYRPDVDYVTGPPFLEPRTLARRAGAASEWETPTRPDPRPALAQFRRDLEARGIALVVVPTPVKPSVHPEGLAAVGGIPVNRSYRTFVDGLRAEGTLVFDPAEALVDARRLGPQYLETDTHWRPEAMEDVAEQLARFVSAHVELVGAAAPRYRVERVEIVNAGDTARMLDLPGGSVLYPPESVWIRRILQADGSPWRPSRDADVLLLGDSFTNIYALESMAWGTSAGLAEQLSHALRRPVDRLTQNDDAAFATRALLARQPGRLAGTRVVIYQFAVRELAFGDWRVLPLPD